MPRTFNNGPTRHYVGHAHEPYNTHFRYYRQLPLSPIGSGATVHMPGLPLIMSSGTPFGQIFPRPPLGIMIKTRVSGPCPMSPYAKFLSNEQQEALAELVTEARKEGASEPEVHEYIDKYVKQILTPEKYASFQQYNSEFEEQRKRGKRDVVQGT
uniref:Uncharacterized protein n=1 Tax=Acrobeloides nanus TaxID=290746 RepID=A0A914EDC4_9BILA